MATTIVVTLSSVYSRCQRGRSPYPGVVPLSWQNVLKYGYERNFMCGDCGVPLSRAPPSCVAQWGTSTETVVLVVTPTVGAVIADDAFWVRRLTFSRFVAGPPQTQHLSGKLNSAGNGELKMASSAIRSSAVGHSKPSFPSE